MTQRVIIDAARELFEQKGYDETSMEDVASAAGCSRRTPYNHFENKRNLWFAVVHDDNETFFEVMQNAAETSTGSALDRYRSIARSGFHFMAEHPEVDRRVNEFQGRSQQDPQTPAFQYPFARRCAEVNDRIADLVSRTIAEARSEGSIRSDEDPVALLLYTAGVMTGACHLAQLRRASGDPEIEEIFERGWNHSLRILNATD